MLLLNYFSEKFRKFRYSIKDKYEEINFTADDIRIQFYIL